MEATLSLNPAGAGPSALRNAVAVIFSSAELFQSRIERMSKATRDRQLSVLHAETTEVLCEVELLMEGER